MFSKLQKSKTISIKNIELHRTAYIEKHAENVAHERQTAV